MDAYSDLTDDDVDAHDAELQKLQRFEQSESRKTFRPNNSFGNIEKNELIFSNF